MSALIHLTESVTAFAAKAEWTGIVQTDEPKWLAARRAMLTASDMAAVLDLDDTAGTDKKSSLAVYTEKVLGHVPEIIGPDDPRFWGRVLEQPILTAAATWHGWRYRQGGALLRSREHPWLGCTLDAEIDQNLGYGWEPLEGKTSQISKAWDEDSGALPCGIIIQCQTQLLVTGAQVMTVYALLQGCRPVKIQILPDPEFHRVLIEEGEAFMDRLAKLQPPEPDWRATTTRALNRLYPGLNGSTIDLPREAVEKTIELYGLRKEAELLERRQKAIRNWMRHKIGPAMYGRLERPVNGRVVWRWAPNRAGSKTLLHMTKLPGGARAYGQNGSPVENDDGILEALQASVAKPALPPAAPTRPRTRPPAALPPSLPPTDLDAAYEAAVEEPAPTIAKCSEPKLPGDEPAIQKFRIKKGKRR